MDRWIDKDKKNNMLAWLNINKVCFMLLIDFSIYYPFFSNICFLYGYGNSVTGI